MVSKLLRRRKQGGATMVEMAITLPLFLILVFGIFEFALVIFSFTRAVEATRAGVRYAIVNDSVTDLSGMDCSTHAPGAEVTPVTASCADEDCSAMITRMQSLYPVLDGDNVRVVYECSFTGFSDNPNPVMQVTISIEGQEHSLMLPGLMGLDSTLTLPSFASTRTSEDMHTYVGP
ncbi:TadE family protein [Alcanivorax nanhaiticus]|uniref:TadE family protein n=1 Tax=Alcanivorax nanhaiticus TaxID=1177154 RepID=A0A095SIN4_9GAMM|nr:TadE family protein [Alcanivorax nanhaiticus]KGD64511.1 TadE family protein [Alcanivorax nanhaiticus]